MSAHHTTSANANMPGISASKDKQDSTQPRPAHSAANGSFSFTLTNLLKNYLGPKFPSLIWSQIPKLPWLSSSCSSNSPLLCIHWKFSSLRPLHVSQWRINTDAFLYGCGWQPVLYTETWSQKSKQIKPPNKQKGQKFRTKFTWKIWTSNISFK